MVVAGIPTAFPQDVAGLLTLTDGTKILQSQALEALRNHFATTVFRPPNIFFIRQVNVW
ncbi:hypothetical protein ACJ4Z0_03940 [Bifidobacterium catenulatum]|uniref:hypothetical protein n=1 Tax=Bifidobacterium catenulatum TaxID=1686 RepID=UPI003D2EDC7B